MLKRFFSTSKPTKSIESNENQSCVNFDLNLQLKIKENLLIKIISLFLGGSVLLGGATHHFINSPSRIDNRIELDGKF